MVRETRTTATGNRVLFDNIMRQDEIIETFETSIIINIWVQRNSVVTCLITGIITIYAQLGLIAFFEALLGIFLFSGVVMLGFAGIVIHVKYYYHFEKNRRVELYTDRIEISRNGKVVKQVFKDDITGIILCDRLKSGGYNLYPTFADPYYYLDVIDKNKEEVILTCLLDIRLKKKIAAWYGQEPEHKYKFFPYPDW